MTPDLRYAGAVLVSKHHVTPDLIWSRLELLFISRRCSVGLVAKHNVTPDLRYNRQLQYRSLILKEAARASLEILLLGSESFTGNPLLMKVSEDCEESKCVCGL